MDRKTTVTLLLVVLITTQAACALPGLGGGEISDVDRLNTAAAQTVSALGTEVASGRTATPIGWPTTTQTLEVRVATLTPTPTQTATPTRTSTEGGTPIPCNSASFISDVTIPDGSTILPGSTFVKTWAIKNTGSCAWNSSYSVVFADRGTAMTSSPSQPLLSGSEVKPGETAMVSVTLTAPTSPGEYDGYWQLRSGDNKGFGIGENSATPFFVKIRVAEEYNFVEHACSAFWSNGKETLPCPGSEGDQKGYVVSKKDLTLEDDETYEGLGLITRPNPVPDGLITGTYPAIVIPSGEFDFRSFISCPQNAPGCYLRYRVTYRVDGSEEQLLGEWNEGYEGQINRVAADLDGLAGRQVSFTFSVIVAGVPEASRGIWFNPRITK